MNTSKQLFTHISSGGELTLSLVEVDVPKPKAHEIVVKKEINREPMIVAKKKIALV